MVRVPNRKGATAQLTPLSLTSISLRPSLTCAPAPLSSVTAKGQPNSWRSGLLTVGCLMATCTPSLKGPTRRYTASGAPLHGISVVLSSCEVVGAQPLLDGPPHDTWTDQIAGGSPGGLRMYWQQLKKWYPLLMCTHQQFRIHEWRN